MLLNKILSKKGENILAFFLFFWYPYIIGGIKYERK